MQKEVIKQAKKVYNLQNYQVGDVLVDCFGYSMTLYNFYKIVEIKNSKVVLLKLQKTISWHGFLQCFVNPVINHIVYSNKEYLKENLSSHRFTKNGNISLGKYHGYLYRYDTKRVYDENHAD